jgi:drug/metabolite transporter (DMT)-like permease
MYQYYFYFLIIISIIKGVFPYFTKYIMGVLDAFELFFIITLFVFVLLLMYLCYRSFYDKNSNMILKMCKKYTQLSHSHYGCIFTIALFTIVSSLMLYDLNKNYNTPLLNSLFLRCISIFAIFITSIFIFKEKYNWKQMLGIFIIMIGFIITSTNTSGL